MGTSLTMLKNYYFDAFDMRQADKMRKLDIGRLLETNSNV